MYAPEGKRQRCFRQTRQPPAVFRLHMQIYMSAIRVHARWMREHDTQGHFIYGVFCFACAWLFKWAERGRDPGREDVWRGESRVQFTFDNWLRDLHQNEIMLVNLSSINYLRNRPQYIHYFSVLILLKEKSSHIIPTVPTCSAIVMLVSIEGAIIAKKNKNK